MYKRQERALDKREVGSSNLPRPTNPAFAGYPRFFANCRGAIAQLGERLLCKQEVVGSIPSGSTSGDSYRPRLKISSVKMNSRNATKPSMGVIASRVLSDIVKRRSFRANVAAKGRDVRALLMTCSIAATIHRPMSRHVHVGEA